MNFSITTLSPTWYLLLCILAAGLLTWLLYRNHSFENKIWLRTMVVLRFLGLFLVFFLLLSPIIKLRINKEIKPRLVLFYDKSLSADSSQINSIQAELAKNKDKLEEKFDLKEFYFGREVSTNPQLVDHTRTSLSAVLDRTNDEFSSSVRGAAVVVTDGIYNAGLNPLFKTVQHGIPIFTLGVGDTIQHPDIWVTGFTANATAYLGNEFIISSQWRAAGYSGKNALVELLEDGRKIQSKSIRVSDDNYFENVDWVVKPTTPGLKKYELKIAPVAGENTIKNNGEQLWVEVTNTKRKVQLVYHAPNPDVGAITRALEDFGQYELTKAVAEKAVLSDKIDLYILHGFCANGAEQQFVNQLLKAKIPFWMILSAQSSNRFTDFLEYGFSPRFDPSLMADAQAVFNPGFNDFVVDDLLSELKNWPPLKVPNGRYTLPPLFRPMLFQKLGAVETSFPLMGFTNIEGKRQAWLFGEGLWKWRIHNFQKKENTTAFDQLVVKTVQYLSTGEIKNTFKVYAEKNTFGAGESVRVYAEYLDKSGNLYNKADCQLTVSGDGVNKNVAMTASGNRFVADLGGLASGDYALTAKLSNPAQTASGRFAVSATEEELKNTKAEHSFLRVLAARNQGEFYKQNQVKNLVEKLLNGKYNTAILKEENKVTELIKVKWIFALLILLFGLEWFLRKREGAY